MSKKIMQFLLFLSAFICTQVQATTILQLDPIGGAISGKAGETIGWGFTLTNDTDFLVVTGASINSLTTLGVFTDFISQPSNFFVVGPSPESSFVSQSFDQVLKTGIGSFIIDSGALDGSLVNGQIVLTYDLFSVSPNAPNFDPDFDTLSLGNTLSANASVSVAAPEPAVLALVIIGLAGIGFSKRRSLT